MEAPEQPAKGACVVTQSTLLRCQAKRMHRGPHLVTCCKCTQAQLCTRLNLFAVLDFEACGTCISVQADRVDVNQRTAAVKGQKQNISIAEAWPLPLGLLVSAVPFARKQKFRSDVYQKTLHCLGLGVCYSNPLLPADCDTVKKR